MILRGLSPNGGRFIPRAAIVRVAEGADIDATLANAAVALSRGALNA